MTRFVLIAVCAFASHLTAASVELKSAKERVDVFIDGKPFTSYFLQPDVAKPYLMPLRTASGAVVTRGFPVRNDVSAGNPKSSGFEPHQRPLYFSHGDIDGLDFWQEPVFNKYYNDHGNQAYGHMRLKKLEPVQQAADSGTVTAVFSLEDENNRVIAEETQAYTFRGDQHLRMVDCVFTLHATAGPLVLGDTKEGSFGIRLAPELSAPSGKMINSAGGQGEKQIWGKPADWVDYSGVVDGKQVGVAIFDHPASFRHPTTWHARAYGLFAANPFGTREFTADPAKDGSWTIPEGQSLQFRYRVVIHEGDFAADQLARAYSAYAATK